MRKHVIYLLLPIVLCSCFDVVSDDQAERVVQQEVKATTPAKITPEKKEVETKKPDLITNRNVEERLLEYGKKRKSSKVLIRTDKGDITIRLYENTPLHRASFLLMADSGCFDNTVFTRVSPGFMAQAGGSYDKVIIDRRNSIGRYTIPAEFRKNRYHKQGAVGAARSYNNNPDKRSDPFAFYFVEGSLYNNPTLDKYEETNGRKYSAERRAYYLKNPGAAHIDGEHTVFGEIIDGFEIIPMITSVKKDSRDWPTTDIYIQEVIVLD